MAIETYDTNVFSVCANTSAAALMDRSLPLLGMRYTYDGKPSRCTSLTATLIRDGVFRVDAKFETCKDELQIENAMRWSR